MTIALAARPARPARPGGGPTSTGPSPAATDYWLAGIAVAGWAGLIAVLAHGDAFASSPPTRVPVVGLAIVLPVIVGRALLGAPAFRAAIERVPLAWLVGVQAYRVVGGVFLIAQLQDTLPAEFALPAGIGDVRVGLTAPVVAYRLATVGPGRAGSAAIAWCAFGITDLVVAVTCGFLTAPSVFQQLALATSNAAIHALAAGPDPDVRRARLGRPPPLRAPPARSPAAGGDVRRPGRPRPAPTLLAVRPAPQRRATRGPPWSAPARPAYPG